MTNLHCTITPLPRNGIVTAALACCLCASLSSAWARAGETGFYSSGTFHPLIVSETELAVELADPADGEQIQQRMRSTSAGVLEAVPWGEQNARFAILRLPQAGEQQRLRARQDHGFHSVNRVYRFRADALPALSTGRIVVRLAQGLDDVERDRLFAEYQVAIVERVPGLRDTYVVEPVGGIADTDLDTANALYRDDRTLYAHPDLRLPIRTRQVIFTADTFSDQQWYLDNTGQGGGTPGADINILPAWVRTFGATILVGQLDDSCEVEHEDLVDNYLGTSHDTSDNSQNDTAANPQDPGDRHGTSTMGLMVATANSIGIRGIAPLATFTASRGLQEFVSTSQIAGAYTFARNQNVDVHNNSWGFGAGTPNPDVIVDAIQTAFDEGRSGRGMVICFASGNGSGMEEGDPTAIEVEAGEELATLSTVIGVGASNAEDSAAVYSNFGVDIDVLAPSSDFPADGTSLPAIVTTDNTDGRFVEPGYNNGGFDDFGAPNLADPNYTNNFGGTSASSAIVSGIAALILALEPDFTPTTVRGIIEHTCDKISQVDAQYNGITGRSLHYGYGRVNAGEAVEATFDGYFWPERVADVRVDDNTIFWKKNDDIRDLGEVAIGVRTQSVLVVESTSPFAWVPADGTAYDVGDVVDAASGATVVANLDVELYTFQPTGGTKYFGIYSMTVTPQRGETYGFGVSVNSQGVVIDSGETAAPGGGDDGDDVVPPGTDRPKVSIEVTPLSGTSPLTVSFFGNAQSAVEIESFVWDFDDGTTDNHRNTQHTYTVTSGSRRFFPRLTVTDVEGNQGERSIAVDVAAPQSGDGTDGGSGSTIVTIRIADPNSPTSDISSGVAPLAVLLSAEISGPDVSLEDIEVLWDLGDGNVADSLTVSHVYQVPGRFPITLRIRLDPTAEPLQATRFIDVLADTTPTPTPTPGPTPPPNGGSGGTCGIGSITVLAGVLLFAGLRRIVP